MQSSLRLNLFLLPFLVREIQLPSPPRVKLSRGPLPPCAPTPRGKETLDAYLSSTHPVSDLQTFFFFDLQTLRRIKTAKWTKGIPKMVPETAILPRMPGNGLHSKYQQLPFLGEITKSIASHSISWRWQVVCLSFFRNTGQIN